MQKLLEGKIDEVLIWFSLQKKQTWTSEDKGVWLMCIYFIISCLRKGKIHWILLISILSRQSSVYMAVWGIHCCRRRSKHIWWFSLEKRPVLLQQFRFHSWNLSSVCKNFWICNMLFLWLLSDSWSMSRIFFK